MLQWIKRVVVLFACASLTLALWPAVAESPNRDDATAIVPYWTGQIPTGRFEGVSMDVAMPLALSLQGSSDLESFLEYVQVSLLSGDGEVISTHVVAFAAFYGARPTPEPSRPYGFLVWTPMEPLRPGEIYQVTVNVDNTTRGCASPCSDISGQFEIEVALSEAPLPLNPTPIISNARLEDSQTQPLSNTAECPEGLYICDTLNRCQATFDYDWYAPTMKFSVEDGEGPGENSFFYYEISLENSGLVTLDIFSLIDVNNILSDVREIDITFFDRLDLYCVKTETTDLRSIVKDTVEQDKRDVVHCLPESERVPANSSRSYENQLARCAPPPDGATFPDTTTPTDTTDTTDTVARTDTDASPSPLPHESECSCKSTRRGGKSPWGFALLAACALVWRRRTSR